MNPKYRPKRIAASLGEGLSIWYDNGMTVRPNIFEVIESGDIDLFIEVVDSAVKQATREASARSHALGLEVADGRAAEDRRRKPVRSA